MSAVLETKQTKIQTLTEAQFHNYIHSNVGQHKKHYTTTNDFGEDQETVEIPRAHRCPWAESSVDLKNKRIIIKVYIDFHSKALKPTEFTRLKKLAEMGISHYWGRNINIAGQSFNTLVNVVNRKSRSIDVNLKISDSKKGARSHNSGIWRATFIYNKGLYKGWPNLADQNFKMVSAHEFGHSVLKYFGGINFSWGHKGSSNVVFQNTKKDAPNYPKENEIDLMKYYNGNYSLDIPARTKANIKDVIRLIWMSNITFI